ATPAEPHVSADAAPVRLGDVRGVGDLPVVQRPRQDALPPERGPRHGAGLLLAERLEHRLCGGGEHHAFRMTTKSARGDPSRPDGQRTRTRAPGSAWRGSYASTTTHGV